MKVGIFTDTYSPEINGVVTSIKQLEAELRKHGHEVYIITASTYRHIVRTDNVIMMPGIALKRLYGYSVSGVYSVMGANYIRKLDLDLIHAQTEYGIGIFARIIALQLDLPLVYTYHTMMEDYSNYITRYTYGHFERQVKKFFTTSSKLYADYCTELIVPSDKTKEAMIRYGVTKKINVIPTGIDLSAFSSHSYKSEQIDHLRAKYKIEADDLLVIFVGRLAPEKNIMEIVDAFDILKEKSIDNIKLLIVGDGPSYDEIEERINNEGLSKSIHLTGKITHDEVPLYYQLADVFVSTSLSETQGLTFIEAMASHLPIICREDENLKDIVIEGKTGFFIDSVEELANKLIELEKVDQYEFNEYGNNARKIANKYSSTIFYEKVMVVYDNAIRSKRRETIKTKKGSARQKPL